VPSKNVVKADDFACSGGKRDLGNQQIGNEDGIRKGWNKDPG
jgi:hypothetical protein